MPFKPCSAPTGTLLTPIVSVFGGISQISQCKKSPLTASGSCIISVRPWVLLGTLRICSGGLTFWPLQVYCGGIGLPSRNTELITSRPSAPVSLSLSKAVSAVINNPIYKQANYSLSTPVEQ